MSTSEKVNETEEKDLLPISEKHFPDAAFRAYIEEEVDTNRDVSKNPKLTYLYCSDNQLDSLDLTANTCLTNLYCHKNQLTSLKVYPDEFTGIVADPGVDISGNENGYMATLRTNDMVVKIDPVTGAATYPDGGYRCWVINDNNDPDNNIKSVESIAEGWCTAARVENGYLYIDGYMNYYFDTSDHEGQIGYIGDGHLCLPLAENVKYYSFGEGAYEVTQDEVIYGPIIYAEIKDGVVVEVSCSA